MKRSPVTEGEIAEFRRLADEGHSLLSIMRATGRAHSTVYYHAAGRLKRPPYYKHEVDVVRARRLVSAVTNAEHGLRDDIARRFGLANADVLRVKAHRTRRILKARA